MKGLEDLAFLVYSRDGKANITETFRMERKLLNKTTLGFSVCWNKLVIAYCLHLSLIGEEGAKCWVIEKTE